MSIYIVYIILSILGVILMKIGGQGFSLNLGEGFLQLKVNFKLILAMVTYICSFLLWMIIINKNNISFIMPMTAAITNVLGVLAGILIFKESLSATQIIGIIIATIGIIIMNIK